VAKGAARTVSIPEMITQDPRTGRKTTHKSREVSVDPKPQTLNP